MMSSLTLVFLAFIALSVYSFDKNRRQKAPNRFAINTKGCSIPDFDLFDSTFRRNYFEYDKPVPKCNKGYPPLVDSNFTSIFLIKTSMRFYGILKEKLLSCHYTPFYRVKPRGTHKDNQWKFKESRYFNDSAHVENKEFIIVSCFYDKIHIYKDFFSFVPSKNLAVVNKGDGFNILLIGLDGISRLNFYRQMKETRLILEKMEAVELLGYNKIGYSSFPNLIAILSGLSDCQSKIGYFDDCPFVWNAFKKKGYVTVMGEDNSQVGTFHYSSRKGFRVQPTDYCWSYFDQVAEHHTGNFGNEAIWDCIGAREAYKVFLDYIRRFTVKMREDNVRYFGYFFETAMSHDYIGKPKLTDSTIADFLDSYLRKEVLDDTVLFFFSDHGMRWGTFRKTYQGALEEKLPFFYIYLPETFKRKYSVAYNNLLINRKRLTTPYDVHQTLLDLSNSDKEINSALNGPQRFYSLFQEIPENRTCEDASIPLHYCACYKSTELSIKDTTVKEVVNFVISHLNGILINTLCKTLYLDTVLIARVHILNDSVTKNTFKYFIVVFRTLPGGGEFEATVETNEVVKGHPVKKLVGTVSRINLYGNQSVCIEDFRLKLYCYCP